MMIPKQPPPRPFVVIPTSAGERATTPGAHDDDRKKVKGQEEREK